MSEFDKMVEIGAKALAEYYAPNAGDLISEELMNAHRRAVVAILKAIKTPANLRSGRKAK